MGLLTGKQYRERNRKRVNLWRKSLKEQGYKNYNLMLSPNIQKAIKQVKEGTKLSNAEVLDKIIKEWREFKQSEKIPPWSDKKSYTFYIQKKILLLQYQGLSHKQIAKEFTRKELKTIEGGETIWTKKIITQLFNKVI